MNSFLRRSSCLRAVMSRATFDAPMILSSAFLTGEIVNDTSIRLPSLRNRTVSKCSMDSPRRICSVIAGSSFACSGGTRIESVFEMRYSRRRRWDQPIRRSAPPGPGAAPRR